MACAGCRVIVPADEGAAWVLSGARDGAGGVWAVRVEPDGRLRRGRLVRPIPHASFAARHPARPVRYVVVEEVPGALVTLSDGGAVLGRHPLAAAQPCHVTAHPSGGWLYVAGYRDGVVEGLRLGADGVPDGEVVVLPPVAGRDAAARPSHAHATALSPGGGFLLATDLGRDELRGYPLDGGRPSGPAVVTAMPPGFGPRHLAVVGDRIYVTGEPSGSLAVVAWEGGGRGRVLAAVPTSAGAPSDAPAGAPSDVLALGARLVVAVRGPDELVVLSRDDRPTVMHTVATVPSPRHLAVVGGHLLVAGQLGDAVGLHPLVDGVPGPLADRMPMPHPMFVLGPASGGAPPMP